ncbi:MULTISPECIES: ABC transporter substrate-binding protein [Microbacterium]|uniref:Iron-siderophore ABC transporter substrate-binding protein n=1 Tax=Microbacterium wangchenii TaxID=2541726 RepID=A0ABX5SUU7_9MICO|nr:MULTISPECIES: ABC transporter substrate-binding protein [Microbacterium]MCK6065154.1 ABC transporter substrate-binding protein [Microbacterium sp. EYE_512]QBR88609.1 iron-siderophore ABC transporter substrate-binding protein [Microbacterium wangchenii]TXK20334.1 ABC transporter substrate-binding protein [Microbacterium wangchenii]
MTRFSRRLAALAATGAVGALVLAGCASAAPQSATSAGSAGDSEAFPVTMEHMYGTTTLESAPERIATWGWGATDAVLALGIVPVAISSMDYGGGEDRITPWVEDKIDELGGETPVILDNATYELSVEELLAADPDVLIAPYSGLTQEEYDAVTGAGIPVVAPEEALWATPWRDVVTETGTALGMEDEAQQVLDDLDAQIAEAAAEHPEFEGTSIAYAADDVDTFYLYLPADARVEILEDLGFVTADTVTAMDTGESTFYTTVSAENLDAIDAEVIFTQTDSEEQLQTFLTSDRTRIIPAVQKGAVAAIVGEENVAAISPTALTIPWILPRMVEQLAEATAVAQG